MNNMKKHITLISIIVVVICLITILLLYFLTDIFKSNKDIFFKNISQTEFVNYSFIGDIKNNVEKKEENCVSNLNINVYGIQNNQDTSISDTQNILEIKSNRLNNKNLNQTYTDYTFYNDNKQLTTAKIIKDGNKYAFGADNVLTKYIGVENNNLRTFLNKLEIKNVNKFPNTFNNNYSELLNVDKNTINKIKETYGKILYDNIDKKSFEKIKNENKTDSLILKLSKKELINIQNILLQNAKDDDILLDFIVTKTQIAGYDNLNKEYIQKMIQEKINSNLQENFDNDNNSYFVVKTNISNKEIKNIEMKQDIYYINADIVCNQLEKINIKKGNIDYMQISFKYTNNELKNNAQINIINYSKNQSLGIVYEFSSKEKNNITENASISISNNSKNIQISITNITDLKEDIQIEKLTTDNAIILNDYSSENLKNLVNAIKNRINQLFGEKIEKIKTQF